MPVAAHPHIRRLAAAGRAVDPEPTEAQRDAGNYRMGHVHMHGLDISIETAKGQTRTKVSQDGKRWSRKMHHHYGYIRGTQGRDGDHCDVFVGEQPHSELVFVVNQLTPDGKKPDEEKIMLGFTNAADAKEAYLKHYPKDWKGFGGMRAYFMADFKEWLGRRALKKSASLAVSSLLSLVFGSGSRNR